MNGCTDGEVAREEVQTATEFRSCFLQKRSKLCGSFKMVPSSRHEVPEPAATWFLCTCCLAQIVIARYSALKSSKITAAASLPRPEGTCGCRPPGARRGAGGHDPRSPGAAAAGAGAPGCAPSSPAAPPRRRVPAPATRDICASDMRAKKYLPSANTSRYKLTAHPGTGAQL